VLGAICILQAVVLAAIGLLGRPLPPTGSFLVHFPFAELVIGIAVFAVTSMCLGLMVSSLVTTMERTMPLLVLTIFVQIMLSGGVVPVGGMVINQISWLVPGRWGYAAVASTVDLNRLLPPGSSTINSLWQHQASTWLTDIGAMIALSVVFILITWWRLNRLSPGRRK
jgi:ABC transport system ATP-binding/permease protein